MSLNFGQIPPLTTELAALERLKNICQHVISVDIDLIFFKLAGNKDMHNIMNEVKFRPDRTTDYGVSCPWASKKYPYRPYNGENGVSTFSLLFLIGSFWYFHVTRTSIKAWMSVNFLKWDLTLAHWTQVNDRCPLGYLFVIPAGARGGGLIIDCGTAWSYFHCFLVVFDRCMLAWCQAEVFGSCFYSSAGEPKKGALPFISCGGTTTGEGCDHVKPI